MTSARARGNELERRAKKGLEADGWLVERCNPRVMRLPGGRVISASHDYFGAFDLVAMKPSGTRWIQVTTDDRGAASVRRAKIEAVAPRMDRSASYEVWRWQTRKGWWKQRLVFQRFVDRAHAALAWETLEKP